MLSSVAQLIPYSKTGMFKELVLDYLEMKPELRHVFEHDVSLKGITQAIESRENFKTDRSKLVNVLDSWYKESSNIKQRENIQLLLSDKTFTVCTAHQPNIFTGYLYFVYKILHIIKITEELNQKIPDKHFVPVFFMGSEDNDLEELGQIKVDGIKRTWQTNQNGSVGRMLVDKGLIQIINELDGQLSVLPHGSALIEKLKDCYRIGENIAHATFRFINFLFAEYGLLVLIADDARLKLSMIDFFKEDIIEHSPYNLVQETGKFLMDHYAMQVNPREINLFYLLDDIRERIVQKGDHFFIEKTGKQWTKDELLAELEVHPDRFSPNVVLRALYQEVILPNIAFVGGGAEVSYWLELKKMMHHFKVPYPVIILRNSFLITNKSLETTLKGLGFDVKDMFLDLHALMQKLIRNNAEFEVELSSEKIKLKELFHEVSMKNAGIDKSLTQHVEAVQTRILKLMDNMEKKMLRAAKRKYADQQRQLEAVKGKMFPGNNLQERVDNILFFYAQYGPQIIQEIYRHTKSLNQEFCIITLDQ